MLYVLCAGMAADMHPCNVYAAFGITGKQETSSNEYDTIWREIHIPNGAKSHTRPGRPPPNAPSGRRLSSDRQTLPLYLV